MYEKINIPAYPHNGDVTTWLNTLAQNMATAGNYQDKKEIEWIQEVRKAKSWEELEDHTSGGKWKGMDHWRFQRLDLAMSPPLMRVMKSQANFYLKSKLGLQNEKKRDQPTC